MKTEKLPRSIAPAISVFELRAVSKIQAAHKKDPAFRVFSLHYEKCAFAYYSISGRLANPCASSSSVGM